MNKKLMIMMITAALLLTSCGNNNKSNINMDLNSDKDNSAAISGLTTDDTVSNQNIVDLEYETIGDIMEFGDGVVHIITGDMVQIYKVPNDDLNRFYLGQTVYVQKELEDEFSLLPYSNDNFDNRYTTMGDIITRTKAVLISTNDDQLTFLVNDEEITFAYSTDAMLSVDTEYEIDYITFAADDNYILDLYSESDVLDLVIININRNDLGELIIHAKDQIGGEYFIPTNRAVKNFNIQDLTVDQNIKVYAQQILESFPAQVQTNRIDLVDTPSRGHVTVEYDVIGEIIEINNKEVHILSGDMVDIYIVDQSLLETVYLGQTVKLYTQDNKNVIEPFIINDFSVQHTNMGYRITTYEALVTKIKVTDEGTLIFFNVDDQEIEAIYYGGTAINVDHIYEFDTISYVPDELSIIAFYDPESIIEITITDLTRADNGELMLSGTDSNGGAYSIGTSSPIKNFNLSELKTGDVLNVYADAVMESWPMQVNTKKMTLK